jgi:hypothetical protein
MANDFFKKLTGQQPQQQGDSPEQHVDALKKLVGLTVKKVDETLTDDIAQLIRSGMHNGVSGYLHCLSRLMRHEVAWDIVCEAYRRNEQKPPAKYANLFGRDESGNRVARPSNWVVG